MNQQLSRQIDELIDTAKKQSNSLERNKIVSHLEDAKAWAIRQEVRVPASLVATEPMQSQTCTCPPGALDKTCPVHSV